MSKPFPRKNGRDDRPEDRKLPAPRKEERRQPAHSDGPNHERLTGLCKNCENRFDCLLPKPEGGVWHCEEYR